MTAGLPGSGIGGLFYLISALAMPVVELWRAARGRANPDRQRVALRQSVMAAAIIGVVWLTGLALALLHLTNPARDATGALRLLWVAPGLIAFGTLATVLLAVELLAVALAVGSRVSGRLSDEAAASGGDR